MTAIILPVRGAGGLLDGCLERLLPEAARAGVEVVVVDDASSDDTAARAERRGVQVIRRSDPGGPYRAREAGWRATDADTLVFLDVRCRVHDGWLDALRRPLEDPSVAIAGAGYRVEGGRRLAHRVVARAQPFRASVSLGDPTLPYVPGGNLAIRRPTLEAVGGWPTDLVSGGDLVVCWAAQVHGLGRVVDAPGAEVAWIPRDRLTDYLRQRAKYGTARPAIVGRFADHGIEPPVPARHPVAGPVAWYLQDLIRERGRQPLVLGATRLGEIAYRVAYRRAYRRRAGDSGG